MSETNENPHENCMACGHYHGGVNERFICLETTITQLRNEATEREQELTLLREFKARIKKPVEEFHRIPVTPGGHFDRRKKR